jgi:mRNA-degrading endonuclease RelE of RelBE toxin-antitoxin system
MSFELIPTSVFLKELKKLKKKYSSLESDLEKLGEMLLSNPTMGIEVYKNCYKIRFAIKSKSKGKSGGGRLITWVKLEKERIYLLSIYDKSEKESISDQYIKALLDSLET